MRLPDRRDSGRPLVQGIRHFSRGRLTLGRRGRWGWAVLSNRPVQLRRPLQWGNAQQLVENPCALSLLAQGCRPVASPVVQPHELAMRRFVQGVQGEPASGVQQGLLVPARGAVMVYQTLEHVGQVATQALGLPELSNVETGAVAQAEICQEVATIELCRLGRCYDADRADVVWGVRVCLALRTQRAKLERINPGFGVRSSPTASRPILNPSLAMALLSVESVRLKAARARVSSASGHSSAASASLRCVSPVTARYARSTVAMVCQPRWPSRRPRCEVYRAKTALAPAGVLLLFRETVLHDSNEVHAATVAVTVPRR